MNHLVDEEADGVDDWPHKVLSPSLLLHQRYDHSAALFPILRVIVLLQEPNAVLRVCPESVCGNR